MEGGRRWPGGKVAKRVVLFPAHVRIQCININDGKFMISFIISFIDLFVINELRQTVSIIKSLPKVICTLKIWLIVHVSQRGDAKSVNLPPFGILLKKTSK